MAPFTGLQAQRYWRHAARWVVLRLAVPPVLSVDKYRTTASSPDRQQPSTALIQATSRVFPRRCQKCGRGCGAPQEKLASQAAATCQQHM
jgi:hypothetical protein